MKRLISVIAIIALLFSFATLFACGGEEVQEKEPAQDQQDSEVKEDVQQETEKDTEDKDDAADPVVPENAADEDVVDLAAYEGNLKDRIAGGEEIFVGIIPPTLAAQRLAGICQYVADYFIAMGGEAQITSAEGNDANYITLIENYISMGADAILVIPQQTDAIKDICVTAMESGTHIVMLGVTPDYDPSGLLCTDFYATGCHAANLLLHWVHSQNPDAAADSIPVAVHGSATVDDAVKRTNGYHDTIEADELTYVDFSTEAVDGANSEEAWEFTQDALTYNPNLRNFIYYEIDAAIGGNNYIISIDGVDLSQFGIACVGQNDAGLALIDQGTENNESCMRGTISYGGEQPGIQLSEIILRLFNGDQAPLIYYDEIYTYNHIGYVVE